MKARDALREPPPSILYHYTTQAGLLGIVRRSELWATHTQYMNDSAEFVHALGLFREEIGRRLRSEADSARKFLTRMSEAAEQDGLSSINVCVCSFSEDGDSLPQWRAYGGPTGGFAIGFSGGLLQAVALGKNPTEYEAGWLVRCRYGDAEKRKLVNTLLDDVLEEYQAAENGMYDGWPGEDEDDAKRLKDRLTAYLFRYAPILKHESFAQEREWRIITRPLANTFEEFDFREGISTIVPYYRLSLSRAPFPFEIAEVIVGPNPDPVRGARAVNSFLSKHEPPHAYIRETPVRNSKVPFRSW